MADDAVKSARRVFEILEYFERHRRPMALKEILEGLGYPASSGSALLKSLVALGYLDYDRERRSYFPTMRIAALGAWVHDSLFGDGQVSRLMNHLYEATGETVILAAQSDLHAQYVHLIRSAEPLSVAVPPGARRALRCLPRSQGHRIPPREAPWTSNSATSKTCWPNRSSGS